MDNKDKPPQLTDLFKEQTEEAVSSKTTSHRIIFKRMSVGGFKIHSSSHLTPQVVEQTQRHIKIELIDLRLSTQDQERQWNRTTSMIHKIYLEQDLHLNPYRMIFYCYHPTSHHFSLWKPINFKTIGKGRNSQNIGKAFTTLQLRQRRIQRYDA